MADAAKSEYKRWGYEYKLIQGQTKAQKKKQHF